MSAVPLGRIVAAIEEVPRALLRDRSAGPEDFRLVADKLAHAAAQVRTLAECQPEPVRPARQHILLVGARA